MAAESGQISRNRLTEFLVSRIDEIEEGEPSHVDQALRKLLYDAVEGLCALDLGEVRPMFAPNPGKRWGRNPAKARELQQRAVVSVLMLQEKGHAVSGAIEKVADLYHVSQETIRKWRKEFKTEETRLLLQLYRTRSKLWGPTNDEYLIEQIARDGKEFQKARSGKSPAPGSGKK